VQLNLEAFPRGGGIWKNAFLSESPMVSPVLYSGDVPDSGSAAFVGEVTSDSGLTLGMLVFAAHHFLQNRTLTKPGFQMCPVKKSLIYEQAAILAVDRYDYNYFEGHKMLFGRSTPGSYTCPRLPKSGKLKE
jgi:hypothetical protein